MSQGIVRIQVIGLGEPISDMLVSLEKDGSLRNGTTDADGSVEFPVNTEGNVSITINGDNGVIEYNMLEGTLFIVRSYDLILLTGPLVVILIISVMTIVAIQIGRMYFGGSWSIPSTDGMSKKKSQRPRHESSLMAGGRDRKKGSGLSKL
jgi:hypothetical protein